MGHTSCHGDENGAIDREITSVGPERPVRDQFIDALRVIAVLTVVIGHWLTTTVIWEPGRIVGENALSVIPAAHPVTWLLQVMPLLFFVGGFANARSLAHHDGDYLGFLRTRLGRLLPPTVGFMVVWLLIASVAAPLPLPEPNVIERAADIAALPFWFLGLYLVVVALAPAMRRLHHRGGWWIPAVMVVGAAMVDLLVHGFGLEAVGVANYGFVWLFAHQLGIIYSEPRSTRISVRSAAVIAAAGLAGLVALVTIGGYPVSMVGVPGEDRWNTDPPSLALVALTLWLLGLAGALRRWMRVWGSRLSSLLGRLNGVALTMYLWHVSALAIAAAIVYPLGFPRTETGTTVWWLIRPLWLVVVAPFLVLLVYLFRRLEVHPAPQPLPTHSQQRTRYVVAALAVVSLALGILGFGVAGFDNPLRELGETVLAFSVNPLQNSLHVLVGLVLLGVAFPTRSDPTRSRSTRAYATRYVGLGGSAGAALYLLLGIAGWSNGLSVLALNPATARLHVVLGAVGLVAVLIAQTAERQLRGD